MTLELAPPPHSPLFKKVQVGPIPFYVLVCIVVIIRVIDDKLFKKLSMFSMLRFGSQTESVTYKNLNLNEANQARTTIETVFCCFYKHLGENCCPYIKLFIELLQLCKISCSVYGRYLLICSFVFCVRGP